MRRWRFIKEKTKERLLMYLGETMVVFYSRERQPYSTTPEMVLAGKDVTTSNRNRTMSPTISYTTGVT